MNPYNPEPLSFPDGGKSKAGITISLNREEDREPFEVTVFFKNSGGPPEEDAISVTASGKLTLNIGKNGRVELFGENTRMIQRLEDREADHEMPCM
jgi:hypothetical protein